MSRSNYLLVDLNELAQIIHARNVRLGFYNKDTVRPFDGMLANVHGEVSEALEEWRSGREMTETHWTIVEAEFDDRSLADCLRVVGGKLQVHNYDHDFDRSLPGPEWLEMTPDLLRTMPNMIRHLKPEGIPSELADIIIRVLDICAAEGIDIAAAIADKMAFNETRPYRHGGKKS